MRLRSLLLLLALSAQPGLAQGLRVTKVEPPNWWAGMKLHRVQLMLYGENLGNASVSCASSGLRVLGVQSTGNPSYLFVNVELDSTTQPGTIPLQISAPSGTTTLSYPILPRKESQGRYQGFT